LNQECKEAKIVVRISREEKEEILGFAKEQCVNLSALVRKLLREHIQQLRKERKGA